MKQAFDELESAVKDSYLAIVNSFAELHAVKFLLDFMKRILK